VKILSADFIAEAEALLNTYRWADTPIHTGWRSLVPKMVSPHIHTWSGTRNFGPVKRAMASGCKEPLGDIFPVVVFRPYSWRREQRRDSLFSNSYDYNYRL
jgi:hypothetical protein